MIEKKNPSMMTMLIPWIAFWIAVSITPKVGALITLIVVAGIPFIMRNHEFVIWDQLSMIAVAVLSAAASVTGNGDIPNKYRISCVWIVLAAFMPDKRTFMRYLCKIQLWW